MFSGKSSDFRFICVSTYIIEHVFKCNVYNMNFLHVLKIFRKEVILNLKLYMVLIIRQIRDGIKIINLGQTLSSFHRGD